MSQLLHFGKLIVVTFNFYKAVIYVLCYRGLDSGPPWAVKSCLNRANPTRIFWGRRGGDGVFSDHCFAVIGTHCLFYHQLMGALPPHPYQGSTAGPHWGTGTTVPRPPEPSNPPTLLPTILTIPKEWRVPAELNVKFSIVVPSPRSDYGCATAKVNAP